MEQKKVLIYLNGQWCVAGISSHKNGMMVLSLDGASLKVADTEESLRMGPFQMRDMPERPDISKVLVELFKHQHENLESNFFGHARAWVGKTALPGIDVRKDEKGGLLAVFMPAFYREAICVLQLTDHEIACLEDHVNLCVNISRREKVLSSFPECVPV